LIDAEAYLEAARDAGFDFYTGVPCSLLTPLINRVAGDPSLRYVPAASEGEAVAIAAGAWLAGRRTAVMIQNSGLGNAVNPLTSLNYPFRIPTLLVVTWRGGPGVQDEPQHVLMGRVTPDLLDVIQVPHRRFPDRDADVAPALDAAVAAMDETGLPFAFIMEKGDVAAETLGAEPVMAGAPGALADLRVGAAWSSRYAILERVLAAVPVTAALIATTGKTGRELFTIADRPQHLYQVGSMGCAAPMGLGVALHAARPVVVLDGDGAVLMKMGSLATIGATGPGNLIHVVLDNATYDSTGGQPTTAPAVDFAAVALGCGYRKAFLADDPNGVAGALRQALAEAGPHLVHVRIAPGSLAGLGRPTIPPDEVARRFQAFLAGDGTAGKGAP
jgi:phosphonopyruvate decarboxylase